MKNLRTHLILFFKENDSFTAKQQIVDDMREITDFSSEYILRELRHLENEGRIKVEYRGKSGHSHYKYCYSKEEVYHNKIQEEPNQLSMI